MSRQPPHHGEQTLLFVYGTLKRFQINFPFWLSPWSSVCSCCSTLDLPNEEGDTEAEFVGTAQTCDPFPLFVASASYENCSPVLLNLPGEGNTVFGELFLVSAARMRLLDRLEGVSGGLYEPSTIQVRVLRRSAREHTQPGANGGDAPDVVDALVYFRAKKYDEDWRTSRPLISNFSAASSLVREPRTYHCLPAHLKFKNVCPPPCHPKPMVLVILDGVGDVQCESLGGRTPLQAACEDTPDLSLVTRHGVSGMMDPFAAGFACGSDTAHLSMLGYDPKVYYRGRGAFESLGAGMSMEADRDIAFKCNFAVAGSADSGQMPKVLFRRCDRQFTEEGPVLCTALDSTALTHDVLGDLLEHGPHTVRVTYATEHRCGVVITGDFLSDHITGTDPLTDGLDLVACRPTAGFEADESAVYTSRVVMAASRVLSETLRSHPLNAEREACGKRPANIVLLRGASMRNSIPEFERRHGLRGFIVAPTCIIRGLGACCGLDTVDSVGGTGDYHSNIMGKAEAVVRTFASSHTQNNPYHFGVLHVKGTDDAGHDGDAQCKVSMLRRCAEAIGYLWRNLPVGSTIAVTGDHTTICAMEDHATEPVPVSIARIPSSPRDDDASTLAAVGDGPTPQFDEVYCALHGTLGRFEGCHLIDWMKAIHFGSRVA